MPTKGINLTNLSFIILIIIAFPNAGFGQSSSGGACQARASALSDLLGSIDGIAKEPPRVFKTKDEYLRFIMAPPSTVFAVTPEKRAVPEQAARTFLQRWRNLFVNESPSVEFNMIRVRTKESRAYVRYQQKYAGFDVFGAEMIVQVNAVGGIEAVISDIMRDTEALDTKKVSISPLIDALTAQKKGVEFLANKKHQKLKFIASEPVLMIYAPEVVGNKGEVQLVWQMKVTNVGKLSIKECMLVDAQNGEIAFHYPLIYTALNRVITDQQTSETYHEDDFPTNITEIDNIYAYLGFTYDFYLNEHGRDSIDKAGMTLYATVLGNFCDGYWWGGGMDLGEGLGWDDIVGHEFTHGVTERESGLPYSGEQGAINEAFSDMWGEWVDQSYTNGNDTDTPEVKWLIGEDIDWVLLHQRCPETVPEGIIAGRDMKDPTRTDGLLQGGRPDRMSNYIPGGDVHINSGIGSKLAYLLDDGDMFNGYAITEMGTPKTADLFYECQDNLLLWCSDYHDLGNVLILAAINLGFTDEERYNVEKACRAVEIYDTYRFWVKDSSGVPVGWFDDLGNLLLKGALTQNTTPAANPNKDEFRFQNSTGNDVAIIDATNGNMCIKGSLKEQGIWWQEPSEQEHDFIIKNSNGAVVAYINESGDLYLKGELYQRLD